MKDTALAFFDAWASAYDKGAGIYFVLWTVILALVFVIWGMLRGYNRRLKECETHHAQQAKVNARLQKKLAVTMGMLMAAMGDRKAPDGFWEAMFDDDSESIPSWAIQPPSEQRATSYRVGDPHPGV